MRIRRDLELPRTEALIRREGDALVIEPKQSRSLLVILKALRPLHERFPEIEDLPLELVEIEP